MDHDRKEDHEILRKGGFAEGEMSRLSELRKEHAERERRELIAEHRRFEFIRWLVSIGKLTEEITEQQIS
jgi:hypothetical protein